jgi:hypothetical protein
MLQYREYTASQKYRPSPVLIWIAKRLIAPAVRAAARMLPPLRRAMRRNTGYLQGEVFRNRDRGDHRAALAAALEGMARQERLRGRRTWFPDMLEFFWWTFLDLAFREAGELGDEERARVIELLETAHSPGGVYAAWCLQRAAEWRRRSGDVEAVVALARRAVLADSSWPYGHIYLGWLGLVTGRFDPLPHLRDVVRFEPSSVETIRSTRAFQEAPGLLEELGIADLHEPKP